MPTGWMMIFDAFTNATPHTTKPKKVIKPIPNKEIQSPKKMNFVMHI